MKILEPCIPVALTGHLLKRISLLRCSRVSVLRRIVNNETRRFRVPKQLSCKDNCAYLRYTPNSNNPSFSDCVAALVWLTFSLFSDSRFLLSLAFLTHVFSLVEITLPLVSDLLSLNPSLLLNLQRPWMMFGCGTITCLLQRFIRRITTMETSSRSFLT